ncbi:uncharacterized protein LOC121424914 [Lytechinus variegatus]|uniref:uncharacterized protein LOC121424914 n=1 Tax=Lytechinus variegatus TaxID=7654 RepID=UPI001BB15E11|nr:uncharacterized protein LOC121424914 [Lytechinus variegatus]XP_041476737.1 uncharacterized protein LOC121424914 [Lytechinus variegatus]
MLKLISLRTVMKIFGVVMFVIALHLTIEAYSQRKTHADFQYNKNSLTANEQERDAGDKGKVQTSHDKHNYFEYIPMLKNLKLSSDALKFERTNREIKAELNDGRHSKWLANALISMKHNVTFQENRLLYKIHNSVSQRQNHNSPNTCVIKVLQLCRKMCKRMIKEENKRWTKFYCKFSNCHFETKVSDTLEDIKESDVVFLIPEKRDWKSVIDSRPKGQLWVFHSKEAPIHTPEQYPPREFGNPYNISISYLTSVDLAPAYYYVDSHNSEQSPMVLRKKKLMYWASSNCNHTSWGRTRFVHELEKYLDIDTFGLCGRLQCLRYANGCYSIQSDYKFNLALENSQCPEYITEKFWYNALLTGSVPIVYGPSKKDYERLAPPHSFIHFDDFKTVQEFVDYINLLDRNDELYLEYFAWRRVGRVEKSSTMLTTRIQTGDRLCYIIMTLLKKSLRPGEFTWQDDHPNFHDWWTGLCQEETQKKRIMDIDV